MRGFAQPVSDWLSIGRSPVAELSGSSNKFMSFNENELDELLSATPDGDTNELWVDGRKARIVGAYAKDYHDGDNKVIKAKIFYMVMKKIKFPCCLL